MYGICRLSMFSEPGLTVGKQVLGVAIEGRGNSGLGERPDRGHNIVVGPGPLSGRIPVTFGIRVVTGSSGDATAQPCDINIFPAQSESET